jgi:hypothetical protein
MDDGDDDDDVIDERNVEFEHRLSRLKSRR